MKQPEVDMLGPRCDRCVPELVLHGTVLIMNFSAYVVSQIHLVNIHQGIRNAGSPSIWGDLPNIWQVHPVNKPDLCMNKISAEMLKFYIWIIFVRNT